MITVRIIRNASNEKIGFRSAGHAEFDDPGRDIICAAVSVLELNLANSVSEFTDAEFSCEIGEEEGNFSFILSKQKCRTSLRLLPSGAGSCQQGVRKQLFND